ncbi:HK97 family phage prohead protease [Ochrobactrum chromiisoli]|uniref:Uncharacterized protein n=1 Tax=Ochrobactrum chromiisoli TaxID=2993941 RepID=A0ABT3QKU8_9HYPH|nr:hypothetical protein [Ochrobactrum chromiisoli]MCX2696237.1 hypothetical protein [Ochrobactrum chromiisoli]
MPKKLQQNQGQLRTRAFARVPASVDVDKKSFGIVISTETPVRTSIRNPDQPKLDAADAYIEVDEILLASGLDFSRTVGMPLVDCHDTFSGVNTILGKVDDVRSVGTEVHGTAILNSRNADLIGDINDGHYNQISAGYGVNAYEIEHREGDVPVAYATSWTLYEASLVAVGADPNASVRSAGRTIPTPTISFRNKPKKSASKGKNSTRNKRKLEKRKMDESTLEDLITTAEDAVAAVEEAVVAVEDAVAELGDEAPEELIERARKLRADDAEDQEQRKRKKRNDDDDDEPKDERKKRADDEDEEKEEQEIRSIRSVAKSYGLGQLVTDLAKLGTRSSKIRKAVGDAIAARSATSDFGSKASDIEPRKRSVAPTLDTSAIYARRNGLK